MKKPMKILGVVNFWHLVEGGIANLSDSKRKQVSSVKLHNFWLSVQKAINYVVDFLALLVTQTVNVLVQ